jgi:uncharacterized protein (TIGR03000 family)
MKRHTCCILIAVSLFLCAVENVCAWGRAGGFVGFRGGARFGPVGGFRVGPVAGMRYGVPAFHAPLATDFGFGHVAYRPFVGAGHYTAAYAPAVLAARAAAVRNGFYRYGVFGPAWWGANVGAWRPYGWAPARYWVWPTWPVLNTWLGWSAPPIGYDYGANIVYQGDQVYIANQPGPSAEVYYQQASDLAQSVPVAPTSNAKGDDWQPLGVFSLVQGTESDPSAVFQLAINKEGVIAGNYHNPLTNTTLPVRGAVDKKTQRASWTVGEEKTTVYDTGLVNLTKEESPVLIHFGKDRTQQWLLVHVKEADAKTQEASTAAPPAPAPATGETAQITVLVPDDAEVYFDGTETNKTGIERVFTTQPVGKGTFSHTIRARWTQDGLPVDKTIKVSFRAGDKIRVDFMP